MSRFGPDPATLEAAEFPVRNGHDYRIVFDEPAYRDLIDHSRADTSVELCGVLVGKPARDDQGPFLHIRHIIRGEKAASAGANVTFTQQTWEVVNREMDTKYPHLRNVGWYHTHPGFGVFLSGMDEFIQTSTFNDPSHVAFVVDPKSGEEGFFAWQDGKPVPMKHFWIGSEMRYSSPPPAPKAPAPAAAPAEERRKPSDLLDFRFLLKPGYYITILLWGATCASMYYLMSSCMGSPGVRHARLEEETAAILHDLVVRTYLESRQGSGPPDKEVMRELEDLTQSQAKGTLGHQPMLTDAEREKWREALRPAAAAVFLRMAEKREADAKKADKPEILKADAAFWKSLAEKLAPPKKQPEEKPSNEGGDGRQDQNH